MAGLKPSQRSRHCSNPLTASRTRVRGTASICREQIVRVISAYDDLIVRTYRWCRLVKLRERFIDEITKYLPGGEGEGTILDVGSELAFSRSTALNSCRRRTDYECRRLYSPIWQDSLC